MKRPAILTAALLALAGLAAAQPPDPVLAKVRARYRTITAMTAQVTEVLCSAATGTCKRFTGKAEMKRPSKLRLEIDKPEPQLVVCDGKMLTMYLAKEKQAYRFDMAKSDQMLTLLNPLDGLLDGEVVRSEAGGDGAHTLALAVPKLKDSFKEIVLTVDLKTSLITGIEAEDAAGNHAQYEFTGIKLNSKIRDARFTFTVPKGVTVIAR